jgi:hypothetical protein
MQVINPVKPLELWGMFGGALAVIDVAAGLLAKLAPRRGEEDIVAGLGRGGGADFGDSKL